MALPSGSLFRKTYFRIGVPLPDPTRKHHPARMMFPKVWLRKVDVWLHCSLACPPSPLTSTIVSVSLTGIYPTSSASGDAGSVPRAQGRAPASTISRKLLTTSLLTAHCLLHPRCPPPNKTVTPQPAASLDGSPRGCYSYDTLTAILQSRCQNYEQGQAHPQDPEGAR
jgi:hypothetical protein